MIFLFILYQLVQLTLAPLAILTIALWCLKRNIVHNLGQRVGLVPRTPAGKKAIWIHAVSVGEALSVQELIKLIKQEIPNAWCTVTIGTLMGYRMAYKNLPADSISYVPYDFLSCMLLAYYRINPSALIIVEADLWPNLLGLAKLKNIPSFLLNARISKRSEPRVFALKPIMRQLFSCFTHIFPQSTHDQTTLARLGIPAEKLTILGNLKTFNVLYKQRATSKIPACAGYQILLAGSIHPTEDQVYCTLFQQLKPDFPNLKLVLVPRHFTWHDQLVATLTSTNSPYKIYTEQNTSTAPLDLCQALTTNDIVVISRMGMLFDLYQQATLFFLGGTFVHVGGHNLLEPAVWGIPSLVGPYQSFCHDTLASLEAANAARSVRDAHELLKSTRELLENQELHLQMGRNNQTWVEQEAQHVEHILRLHVLQKLQRA